MAMRQIEKMLKDMQSEGKDLSRLKLKKFQKTHHIDCKCKLCEEAKKKNDPRMRGLIEDGFKVYVDGDKKNWFKSPAFCLIFCQFLRVLTSACSLPIIE